MMVIPGVDVNISGKAGFAAMRFSELKDRKCWQDAQLGNHLIKAMPL